MGLNSEWKTGLIGTGLIALGLAAAYPLMPQEDNSTALTEADVTQASSLETVSGWTNKQLGKYERLAPRFEAMANRGEKLRTADCAAYAEHYETVWSTLTFVALTDVTAQAGYPALPNRNQLPASLEQPLDKLGRYKDALARVCPSPNSRLSI